MGIYDRDYYRKDGSSFLGSLADQGRVNTWLIGITVVVFLFQFGMRSNVGGVEQTPVDNLLLLNIDKVYEGQIWRLLTYAFLHDTSNIFHILFNMLMLFWFGRQVEETIGGREYLAFYLVSAVLGGLGFVAANALGFQAAKLALGASGAVTAVLVLAACINPRQVILLFFIVPVPIWGFVILAVALDTFSLLSKADTRTAVSIHLAGAAFGFCYYRFGWSLTRWMSSLSGWKRRRVRPWLVYREDELEEETPTPKPQPRSPVPATSSKLLEDEHLEAQVDKILEKIPRVGMEGLTENERQVLFRASEAIKRRRS